MPEAKLHVVLLRHTPNPEDLVAQSAKLCYSAASIDELQKQIESKEQTGFVDKLADMQHLSPFEHISFTFGVEGISRACSHQLVRHRLASYSQKSQRYVREGQFEYVVPRSVKDALLEDWFIENMRTIQEWYNELISVGIPAEDARFILPNACETKIVITMNARELLHFFKHRCCNRAQWEIRAMAIEMLRLAKSVAPTVFKSAGPGCVAGGCSEGKMSCGKMDEVRKKFGSLQNRETMK